MCGPVLAIHGSITHMMLTFVQLSLGWLGVGGNEFGGFGMTRDRRSSAARHQSKCSGYGLASSQKYVRVRSLPQSHIIL
jgi:hypothetical protein